MKWPSAKYTSSVPLPYYPVVVCNDNCLSTDLFHSGESGSFNVLGQLPCTTGFSPDITLNEGDGGETGSETGVGPRHLKVRRGSDQDTLVTNNVIHTDSASFGSVDECF